MQIRWSLQTLIDWHSMKPIDSSLQMLTGWSLLRQTGSRSLKRIGWRSPMLIDSHLLKQTDLSLRTLTG